jgi:transposase
MTVDHAIDRAGLPVQASADAPFQATCPHCGGPVVLRRRRHGRRPVRTTYFWRHEANVNLTCPGRPTGPNGRRQVRQP